MILYNEKQLECIKHPPAPLMIIAGAGTGKTTTIIGRIAYFIEEREIPPESILALTYTVKAADYLSDSIQNIVGKKSSRINSSNFHSFAFDQVIEYYKAIGYEGPPSIIEPNESKYIIKQLINDNLDSSAIQSILFTSGTQGFPKPVCLTYENFYQSSIKWIKAINLHRNDTYLLSLPLYHIAGLAIIMRALHVGFSINIDNASSGLSNVSVFSVVPTLLIDLMKKKENIESLKKIRCIILSGSKVSKSLLSQCKEHELNIFLSYGMTETCSSICGFWPLKKGNFVQNLVGEPFEGVDIKIKNNQIIIKSNTVMKKYFNGKNTKGQFETSDVGSFKNNYLELNGRLDNMVISGGENIDQVEIIKAISSIGDFDKIIPFKKEDAYWGEINGVYIYTNEKIEPDDIKVKLKKLISKYKIPKEIIIRKSSN